MFTFRKTRPWQRKVPSHTGLCSFETTLDSCQQRLTAWRRLPIVAKEMATSKSAFWTFQPSCRITRVMPSCSPRATKLPWKDLSRHSQPWGLASGTSVLFPKAQPEEKNGLLTYGADSITNSWVGYLSCFGQNLAYAGPNSVVFGLLAAAVIQWTISLGLSEIASCFPSSGVSRRHCCHKSHMLNLMSRDNIISSSS